MAKKKSTKTIVKKHIKKISKAAKKNKGLRVFIIILVLGLLGFGGFFGYKSYNEIMLVEEDYLETIDSISFGEVTSNLELPLNLDNVNISWSSNKDDVISNTGVVSRPLYQDGDVEVILTASFEYQFKEFLSDFLAPYLGFEDYTKDYTVVVKAISLTDEEKVERTLQKLSLENEISSNVELPLISSEGASISWSSSKENVLSSTGVLGEVVEETVVLTATISSGSITETKTFTINVVNPFLKDIKEVINNLYLPKEISTDIMLPQENYLGCNIAWESNSLALSNMGEVTTPLIDTEVVLKAIVTKQGITREKEYLVTVLKSQLEILESEETFDALTKTATYKTFKENNITYKSVRVLVYEDFIQTSDDPNALSENYLKLRTRTNDVSNFIIDEIINPCRIEFEYKYGSQKVSETSVLDVYISTDNGENYTKIDTIDVLHQNEYKKEIIDLSSYNKCMVKVEYNTAETESFIYLENIKVIRNVGENDLTNWLKNNIPSNIESSIFLPTTTSFGGKITYTSSDNNIFTNLGELKDKTNSKNITLNANIVYGSINCNTSVSIKVKGASAGETLEMYFIDLGKYGAADCGESIYIKYNNIDILVDAGDNFNSSKQAISEVINSHLEDGVLEYVIATHPDSDHIGGMVNIFDNYQVDTLIKFNGTHTTAKYTSFVNAYTNEGCDVVDIYDDIVSKTSDKWYIYLSDDVFIRFVDTTYYTSTEPNGRSIVFVLEAFGTKVLMTGDADNGSGHTDLESKYASTVGDIDVLKVVHHATGVGTTPEFLAEVTPEYAIVCNGNYLGNKHGHPNAIAINNIYQYKNSVPIYAICGGGTIVDETIDNTKAYKCSSEERFVDRNGTITLTILDNGTYEFDCEYNEGVLIEFSSTTYWTNNIYKEYSYSEN